MHLEIHIYLTRPRSTFELASCYKMSPVYTQAFEGTACTDSSGSLTLMFLILIAMSFVGMIMIMLRAAIFPCKEVYLSSSLDDEEDEWEEYQAYLRYMAGFVTTWGGTNSADDEKDGNETSSESTSNVHLGNSSSLSSNENIPVGEALDMQTPHKFETFEEDEENPDINEEMMPLSPPDAESTANHSRLYTPQARQTLVGDCGDDDECLPLSPTTPSIANDIRSTRRFQTPDFLTPGTFRRWRRHDEEHLVTTNGNELELPQTPLMLSPSAEGTSVNYFSSILSPMRTENEDRSAKID